MPHRQFTPCVWYPSIYNPWARTSQRRELSKRINSPPPNRYIFNRNQSHRLKSNVRHTIHLQVRSGSERNWRHFPRISIHLQVRLDDHQLFVITQTMWRLPVFDHRLHLRHHVESFIQNGINPVFLNNSRIYYKSVTQTQHTPHSNSEYSFIQIFLYFGKSSH